MTRNKYVRVLLFAGGILFTLLGLIGIILPLLPATPFLLLAAMCYAKSSEKMYGLLMNNRIFGKHLQNYRDKKGISLLNKIIIILFLWPSILFTVYFFAYPVIRASLLLIALVATAHVLGIKTIRNKD